MLNLATLMQLLRLPSHHALRQQPGMERKPSLARVVPLLALLLLLPLKAFGAIPVGNIDNLTTEIATASSISWSHITTADPAVGNTILIVSVSTRPARTASIVTYGAQSLLPLVSQSNANGAVGIEMWYLVAPQQGTHLVTVQLSGGGNPKVVGTAITLTGINQASPIRAFQSAGSTNAGDVSPIVTVPSAAGDWVLDSVTSAGNSVSLTTWDAVLQPRLWFRYNGTTFADVAQAGSSADGASSVTMRWTLGAATPWAIGAVSVIPVTISGTVFEDADFAGAASDYDGGAGDLGLSNVDVELYNGSTDAYIATTTTAADGSYRFPGLADGTYKVRARSATVGDANTPPRGALNGTVPGTWPYPLPEMTWANAAALYGGVSPTVDDTATGDNAGPGDTYATVTVANGADVPNVNLGFAYNLIVNTQDDNRNDSARSTQGSLRQFIKNANAIGPAGGTTANSSQFRMQVPTNQSSGADAWWSLTVANRDLPVLADSGTVLEGSTQRLNSGTDSNARGPEIEITGFGTGGTAIGLQLTGGDITVRELVITSYSLNGIRIDGSNDRVEGCYVGTDATGAADRGMGEDGILITGSGNTIGGAVPAQRNVVSGNTDEGIDIDPGATGNIVIGNYIGTNASADAAIGNGLGGISGGIIIGGNNNRVGGSAAGEGNVIAGNATDGVRVTQASSGNVVRGNYIGTNASGATTIGNTAAGVGIEQDSSNNTIGGAAPGEANTIAYNGGDGVFITGFGSDGNRVSGNAIYANGGLGIDLDPDGVGATGGANNNKARPVITGLTASGSDFIITATVSAGNTVEFFRANNSTPLVNPDPSGSGEGYLYLGRCVDNGACTGPHISAGADGNGGAGTVQATILASGVSGGDTISATASDAANNTSEFSANAVAPVTLTIVKQAWLESGGSPLASPLTAPVGSTIVFLIYVRNTTAIAATDVRINDSLDETAFQYVPGSLVRTVAAAPPADTATDPVIFNATAPGTGTNLSDLASGGDVASAQDTSPPVGVDQITIGAVPAQLNASLTIAGHTTFAIRFRVTVK